MCHGWCYILYMHALFLSSHLGLGEQYLPFREEDSEAQRERIGEGHAVSQWQNWDGDLGLSDCRTNATGVMGRGQTPLAS